MCDLWPAAQCPKLQGRPADLDHADQDQGALNQCLDPPAELVECLVVSISAVPYCGLTVVLL